MSQNTRPAPLNPQAREMVESLDLLFQSVMALLPAEAAGPDTPLTFTEVRATKLLPAEGRIPMRQFAELLGVSLPTATHMVDRLVEKDIVERERPEHDRRLVLVGLSERARAHRETLVHYRTRVIEQILEPLTPAVRRQVARAFHQIAESAAHQVAALQPRAEAGPEPRQPE